jgi:pilus assembly protein Flp/PilA
VREFPIGFMSVAVKMACKSFRDVSKEKTHNKNHRKVNAMLNFICQFVKEEEGASAAEYALLLVVITLGILGAVQLLGGNITTAINTAAGTLTPS